MSTNIFMTIDSLDPATGGPAKSVRYLSEVLIEHGINTELYINKAIPDSIPKEYEKLTFSNKNVIPLLINKIIILEQNLALLNNQELKNIVIHNHGLWLPINRRASYLARNYDIPLIISTRGMLEPWAMNYHYWRKKLAWLLYQQKDLETANVIHATSNQEAKNIRSLGLKLPIAVIPNKNCGR